MGFDGWSCLTPGPGSGPSFDRHGESWRRRSRAPGGRLRGGLFSTPDPRVVCIFISFGSEKAFVAVAALTLIGKPASVCLLRNKAPESPQPARSHPLDNRFPVTLSPRPMAPGFASKFEVGVRRSLVGRTNAIRGNRGQPTWVVGPGNDGPD